MSLRVTVPASVSGPCCMNCASPCYSHSLSFRSVLHELCVSVLQSQPQFPVRAAWTARLRVTVQSLSFRPRSSSFCHSWLSCQQETILFSTAADLFAKIARNALGDGCAPYRSIFLMYRPLLLLFCQSSMHSFVLTASRTDGYQSSGAV